MTSATSPEPDTPPREAALTKSGFYPGYVNLKRDGMGFILTMRGDPQGSPELKCGAQATIRLSDNDLKAFLKDAGQVYIARGR